MKNIPIPSSFPPVRIKDNAVLWQLSKDYGIEAKPCELCREKITLEIVGFSKRGIRHPDYIECQGKGFGAPQFDIVAESLEPTLHHFHCVMNKTFKKSPKVQFSGLR
jgi:hypothetical protein